MIQIVAIVSPVDVIEQTGDICKLSHALLLVLSLITKTKGVSVCPH